MKLDTRFVNFNVPAFLMYQYPIGSDILHREVKEWAIPQPRASAGLSESAVAQELCNLIRSSIKNKAQGNKSGLFLSGGIDSSIVGCLGKEVLGNKLGGAFTVEFETHSEFDEASVIAKHIGLRHYKVTITAKMVAENISEITKIYDEPLGDAGAINNYFLCQAAKEYCDLVICGDGGDEIFGGYPWHHFAKYIRIMNKIPAIIRRAGQLLINGNPTAGYRNRIERILLFPLQTNLDKMILYPTTAMSKQNVEWLLEKGTKINYLYRTINEPDLYKKVLAMDYLNLIPGKFINKLDRFTPKIISPLVDDGIVALAAGLPNKLRKDKYMLRKAAEHLLPDSVVWRKKAGFGTPIADWLNSRELKPMVLDRLENGKLLNEICRKQSLSRITGALKSGRIGSGVAATSLANVIWGLFTLQIWYDV